MPGIKDQENIDELRKRLYERSSGPVPEIEHHRLSQTTVDVSRGWGDPRPVTRPVAIDHEAAPSVLTVPSTSPQEPILEKKKKRPYRLFIVLGSILLFVVTAAISSVYLFFGANQISGRNISLNINAPFSLAAGEKLSFQVALANQNKVKMESTTLIVNYPSGTKSVEDNPKDLFEARIPVTDVAAGEAVNIPVEAILFGEENEEKEIKVSVEYRVTGSNGTFLKEADPIKVKISSSPLVVRVESLEKVSSGQDFEVKLLVQSNAPTVQNNILISASYPNSFAFVSADPEPDYRQNEWIIKELKPESTQVITIKGRINGLASEEAEIQFSAGAASSDNQFMMGSILSKAKTRYTIERPFIDVTVDINKDKDGEVVLKPDETGEVKITVTNTLAETIYDMRLEAAPKGNLIRDSLLAISSGFYDTNTKTIKWEVSGNKDLAQILPGESREFTFSINPDPNQKTASFDISTNVYARRVGESSANEELVGRNLTTAKYSSALKAFSEVGYNSSSFSDSGPVPPVANQTTTYTVTFVVEAGVNDLTGGIFTTTFPQYIKWLDSYQGDGSIDFNPVAKQLRWNVGTMTAGERKTLTAQVSLLPSVTQVGKTPTIVGIQEFRATDRFSGASLSVTNPSRTTELSAEAGWDKDSGRVQSN